MSIDSERLKTTLEQLHRQLAEISTLDPATREELTAALREIQQALQNKQLPPVKPLMRRLGAATRQFEEKHAALAGSFQSLIDTLGRGGI